MSDYINNYLITSDCIEHELERSEAKLKKAGILRSELEQYANIAQIETISLIQSHIDDIKRTLSLLDKEIENSNVIEYSFEISRFIQLCKLFNIYTFIDSREI